MGSPKGAEEGNLNRLASMPAGRSPKGVRRVPSNSQVVHASDDASLTGHSSDEHSHGAAPYTESLGPSPALLLQA